MGISLVRYDIDNQAGWGLLRGEQILPLSGDFSTLAEVLGEGKAELLKLGESSADQGIPLSHVQLLSPVTAPARILCQGPNYGESEDKAKKEEVKTFFIRKDESSLAGPNHNIARPKDTLLLEPSLNLGLVMGKAIQKPVQLTQKEMPEYVAGWVMAVDVTARDLALRHPDHQMFQAKSFRGFCPTGPVLYLPSAEEWAQLSELEIRLWINGDQRQQLFTKRWICPPWEAINQLSQQINLSVGDMLLTGSEELSTIKPPSGMMRRLGGLIFSEEKRLRSFLESVAQEEAFLRDGDKIRASISNGSGTINLGEQRYSIVPSTEVS